MVFLLDPLPSFLGKYVILWGLRISITYGNPFDMNGLWLNISADLTLGRPWRRSRQVSRGSRRARTDPGEWDEFSFDVWIQGSGIGELMRKRDRQSSSRSME